MRKTRSEVARCPNIIFGEAVQREVVLAERIVATPSTNLRDFAAKLLVACDWDDASRFCVGNGAKFLSEARAFIEA